jgi:CDP-glycerol glycerophosphotransferase (TagB/SpsB family)
MNNHKSARIACLISNGFGARLVLKSGVARKLVAQGTSVTVISPNADEPYYQQECRDEGIALRQDPDDRGRAAHRFRTYRPYFLDNVMGNASLKIIHEQYFEGRPALGAALATLNRLLGRNPVVGAAYRMLESRMNRSESVRQLLQELNPDLLVLCSPYGVREVIYLLHAKELGIPVVCQIQSWDNITSKGTPLVMPDYFITWGPIMTQEVTEYYRFPRHKILECGVPHFDVYHRKDQLSSRQAVLESLNLSPDDPYMVFGMVTPYCCPNELDLLMWLSHKINNGMFVKPCSLIIRPHPQTVSGYYAREARELERLMSLAGPRIGIHMPQLSSERLYCDMPRSEMSRIASLLAGSDLCLNVWSTLCLDAFLVDRPVISIGFDGWEELPYEKSARSGPDHIHIAKLLAFGGLRVAKSFEELENHINTYLANSGLEQTGRALAVAQECGPQDGQSTERVVTVLMKLIREQ